MNIYRESLDIIFRKIHPEFVKDCLLESNSRKSISHVSIYGMDFNEFQRCASQAFPFFSPDEIENVYHFIFQKMKDCSKNGENTNIFYLLADFAESVLEIKYGDPVCEATHFLRWRDITFRLGQDIFTTAFFAKRDMRYGNKRTYFAWSPVISSNDPKIREFMKQGIAENHFHLYASVPVFHLSWISLMNHPKDCYRIVKELKKNGLFAENLVPFLSTRVEDYQMSWIEKLQLAAWIRVKLFMRMMEFDEPCTEVTLSDMEVFANSVGRQNREVNSLVAEARFFFGKQVRLSNGKLKCLDYTYTKAFADRRNEGYHRLLVGERYFMYACFCRCFAGNEVQFTDDEKNLFYLYLLIKNNFRGEIVQINQKVGFRNFSYYQNRKTAFWGRYPEYMAEAYRIAINGTIRNNKLNSLEARIMPSDVRSNYAVNVYRIDREVFFSRRVYPGTEDDYFSLSTKDVIADENKMEWFFVIHFPKRKLTRVGQDKKTAGVILPRNHAVRLKTQRQAMALASALMKNNYLCKRIRGIDGCSAEIGCRPETFATDFRFLRNFVSVTRQKENLLGESKVQPLLNATYHVGEDYLELSDGLRAIDEAICFLNLKRGDRIGHALALGIAPEMYYQRKGNHLTVTKQDRLDDLVWLLFRSRELKVFLPDDLRAEFTREAKSLLDQIYGNSIKENLWSAELQDYYESWQLRGDHPDLYKNNDFSEMGKSIDVNQLPGKNFSLRNQYESFKKNEIMKTVLNERNCGLTHYYHFGLEERKRGQEMVLIRINRDYISLIRRMQDGMIEELIEKGIGIECNPSSNVLIGSIERYEEHPIFRFNRFALNENGNTDKQLMVSVNTDDQGIFDTSLENEYTLLANCLEKQINEDGSHKYNSSAIWQYLNHLREMGNMQIFPKAFQSDSESWKEDIY